MYGRVAIFWRPAVEGILIGGRYIAQQTLKRVFAKSDRPVDRSVLAVAAPLNYT